jgi:hypothetical protein
LCAAGEKNLFMSENIQKRTRDRQGEEMRDEPEQSEADIKTLKEFLQGTLGDVASDKGLIIAGILALYEDLRDDMNPPPHVRIAYRRIKADATHSFEGEKP